MIFEQCCAKNNLPVYSRKILQDMTHKFQNIFRNRKEFDTEMGVVNNIRDLQIDSTLPKIEKIKSYLEQMADPYEYQDEGTKVRIRFANTQETLTDRLIAYAGSKAVI